MAALLKISSINAIIFLIIFPHQVDGTFTHFFPSLRNYWTRLWSPNGPTDHPDHQSPAWFVVSPIKWPQDNPSQSHTSSEKHPANSQDNQNWNNNKNIINPNSQIATPQYPYPISQQHVQKPPPPPPPNKHTQIGVLVSNPQPNKIPSSSSLWSSLQPSNLPTINVNQQHLLTSVPKSPIPYPVVVNQGYWQHELSNGFTGENHQTLPAVEHHLVEGQEGFAGLPGRIRAHLTLNYVPSDSSQGVSSFNPRPNGFTSSQMVPGTSLETTSVPSMSFSTTIKPIEDDPTTSVVKVTESYSTKTTAGGSVVLDGKTPIDIRRISSFIHEY